MADPKGADPDVPLSVIGQSWLKVDAAAKVTGQTLFADDLVLLGHKWEPGVPVVAWLALYAALLSVGQLVQTSLNAAGRPAISMALRLCHLVLLTVALLLLAQHGITAVGKRKPSTNVVAVSK